jgi:hypothetical protein
MQKVHVRLKRAIPILQVDLSGRVPTRRRFSRHSLALGRRLNVAIDFSIFSSRLPASA